MVKSTIREVRALVVESTAHHDDPARALQAVREIHAANITALGQRPGVLHIGPVIVTGEGAKLHPFHDVLIAIACGMQVQWNAEHLAGGSLWVDDDCLSVLAAIACDTAQPGEYRVKP